MYGGAWALCVDSLSSLTSEQQQTHENVQSWKQRKHRDIWPQNGYLYDEKNHHVQWSQEQCNYYPYSLQIGPVTIPGLFFIVAGVEPILCLDNLLA